MLLLSTVYPTRRQSRSTLIGHEIRTYDNENQIWKYGRIKASASEDAQPGSGQTCFRVELDDGTDQNVSLRDQKCMIAEEIVWALSSKTGEWTPAQLFKHTSLCRHEVGRRIAGFEMVEYFTSEPTTEWVKNRSTTLLPFEVNQERRFTISQVVVSAMHAAWRESNLRKWWRADGDIRKIDAGSSASCSSSSSGSEGED